MNDRIRQLAEQAGEIEVVTVVDRGDGYMETEVSKEFDKEWFAELIVQECAGLVDNVRMEDGTNRGDFIRKHFGVKEA